MRRACLVAVALAASAVLLNGQSRCCRTNIVASCSVTVVDNEGVLELMSTTGAARTPPDIAGTMPAGLGYFSLPSPYNTRLVKISDTSTTADAIRQDGYNLWEAVSYPDTDCTRYAMISYGASGGAYVISFNFKTEDAPVATQVATSGVLANNNASNWMFSANPATWYYLYARLGTNQFVYRCDVRSLPCNSPTQFIDSRSAAAQAAGLTASNSIVNIDTCDDDRWVFTIQQDVDTQAGAMHDVSENSWVRVAHTDLPGEDGATEGFQEGQGDMYLTSDCQKWNKAYIEDGGRTRQCLGTFGSATCTQPMPADCAWGHFTAGYSDWIAPNYAGCDGTSGNPPYLRWIGGDLGSMLSGTTALGDNGLILYRPGSGNEDFGQPYAKNLTGGLSSSRYFFTHSTRQSLTLYCSTGKRFCEVVLVKYDGSGHVNVCAHTAASLEAGDGDGQGLGADNGATFYYQAPKPSPSRDGKVVMFISNVGTTEQEAFVLNVEPCATRLLAWSGS